MAELSKAYDPASAEGKWYQYWYDHKLYDGEAENVETGRKKEAFTIVIPPPNVTGMLTLGHVLNNTIQDLYVRWKRMQGIRGTLDTGNRPCGNCNSDEGCERAER